MCNFSLEILEVQISTVDNILERTPGLKMDGWIFGYLTSHEAYCLCVGNHSGHNLLARG